VISQSRLTAEVLKVGSLEMLFRLSTRGCLAICATAVVLLFGMGAHVGHADASAAYQHNQTDLEFIEAANRPASRNIELVVYGSRGTPAEYDASKNEVAIET